MSKLKKLILSVSMDMADLNHTSSNILFLIRFTRNLHCDTAKKILHRIVNTDAKTIRVLNFSFNKKFEASFYLSLLEVFFIFLK